MDLLGEAGRGCPSGSPPVEESIKFLLFANLTTSRLLSTCSFNVMCVCPGSGSGMSVSVVSNLSNLLLKVWGVGASTTVAGSKFQFRIVRGTKVSSRTVLIF